MQGEVEYFLTIFGVFTSVCMNVLLKRTTVFQCEKIKEKGGQNLCNFFLRFQSVLHSTDFLCTCFMNY